MAEVKWIKIVTDIFNNKKIRVIESMPEGDSIIVIWFKILMTAGTVNDEGNVYFTKEIPYTDQMLATVFNRPLTTIQLALRTFEEFGMIEIVNDVIHVSNWEKYQNVEGMERVREQTRLRVSKHRELKKLECNVTSNVTVTQGNATDIDKDKERDKERDKEEERDNPPISPLWDFDKHSNVDNAKHLIEDNIYKNTEWFIEHQELWQVVTDWFEYKDSRKPKSSNHYSNEKSISKLLNQIVKACNEYGTDAVIDIINRSMASCYSGIVWDWLKNNKKQVGSISNRVSQVDNW